ncbi:hypothetical protein AW736_15280 [Termitidicoccus mucosus]|uniref:Uncharacterized protein n=2 Tax=Termitidicoccus mucosus TaxID=1184151 RepID=A0A178IIN5_9BACT|nr:hypothetical protein AW736_15280 [Opitutaceae bacterium TSB47]
MGIVFGCALQAAPETSIVVEMPAYQVRADRILPIPETWRHVSVPALVLERGKSVLVAPGYYVLSNLSEQNTRLFINELQLRQFAGTLLWPMLVQMQPRRPAVVILDGSRGAGEDWRLPDGAAWEGDPIKTGVQPGSVSTSGLTTGLQWLSSAQGFSTSLHIDVAGDGTTRVDDGEDWDKPLPAGFVYAAMRGDQVAAWVNAGNPLADVSRPQEEKLAASVSQEQVALALNSFSRPPPAWFLLGMKWLIASTEVSRTRITFARINVSVPTETRSDISTNAQTLIDGGVPPPPTVSTRVAPVSIHLSSLLPMLKKNGEFEFEETQVASALVHYGLYGDNGKHRQKLMSLVERQSAGEELTEALFKEVFGFDTKKMLSKLSVYIRTFAAYKHHELRGKIPPMPEIGVSQATQAEAARLQAEAFIALGRPDLALDKLRIAYWRGEREPEMLAVLALLEQRAGSEARARKIVQTLMKLPRPPLRARIVAAKLRLQDALSARPEGAKLSMDETVEIMGMLSVALSQGVPDEDVCETFARVMSSSPAQPPPNVIDFLKKAAARYSNNSVIVGAARLAGASP